MVNNKNMLALAGIVNAETLENNPKLIKLTIDKI
jgi:hypothetical protein